MVSITVLNEEIFTQITAGLHSDECARMREVLALVHSLYVDKVILSGQSAYDFSIRTARHLASLNMDVGARVAGLLLALFEVHPQASEQIESHFGTEVVSLITGVHQLLRLRALNMPPQETGRRKNTEQQIAAQIEALRKMLLAMASDMRVVLICLAVRVTTLHYFADQKIANDQVRHYARETLNLYTPLANRLGVWQLKWELEDLSFRFLEPEAYKRIARMLEEKRIERDQFVESAIIRLNTALSAASIAAEVSGRSKHIYSIWNKMRGKTLDFGNLYDVRAFRIIVEDIKTCYVVLSVVHDVWVPVTEEFDDYIVRPKSNGYQSLHTVVMADDQRPMEIQIRTRAMHQFSEYGVAAHWRYKEAGGSNFSGQQYDQKIAWLRQLLAWKSEVTDAVVGQERDHREWVEQLQSTGLDDRIYVMTPQARVIELPSGATPIDFAYHLHSEVGHRCRGARIDGVMAPLNTVLKNGQTVEIITAKGDLSAGPSRDWLGTGYIVSARARTKVRAWFNVIEQQETLAHGRAVLEKTLQREGKTSVNLEELARKLGFAKLEEFLLSIGKDECSVRQIEQAVQMDALVKPSSVLDEVVTNKSRSSSVTQGAKSGVLIVGTDGLMTQLARCCKPAPPDDVVGFVTRGKGVSIHRSTCKNFAQMRSKVPERVIQADWGLPGKETVYPVDIFVLATDRQGLLRDISEIFSREKVNVTGVSSQSSKGQAHMSFVVEISSTAQLQKALVIIREITGVIEAARS